MAELDEEKLADLLRGFAHWLARHVAAMPLDDRKGGFAIAERSVRDAVQDLDPHEVEFLVERQMYMVRKLVAEIDRGNGRRGGTH